MGTSKDGVVDGTPGDDRIDLAYVGDPEGDRIDNGDAILPGAGPDDDVVEALAGDDVILAGEGDDTVYAGSGNDFVDGGPGNDVIYGDSNGPCNEPATVREAFQWDLAPDPDDGGQVDVYDNLSGGFVQNTGNVNVTFSVTSETGMATTFSGEENLVTDIDAGGTTVGAYSALDSLGHGAGSSAGYQLEFDTEVENVSFRINDIDGDAVVRVQAFDADGNPLEVVLTGGANLTMLDTDTVAGVDTADSDGGYADTDSADYSVLVTIAGPVSRLTVSHVQNGPETSGVTITDVYFDVLAGDTGADGNDELHGGDGDDIIYGEGGDDIITGGAGSDTVDGGDGNDAIDTGGPLSSNLPDRGFPSFEGLPAIPADPDPFNDRDTVFGGAGDDTIRTGDDNDVIDGGAGNDAIDGGLDDDIIDGGAGSDMIVGGEGADTIDGGEGDDTIYGGLDPVFPDLLNITDDGSDGRDPDPDPTNGMDVVHGGAGNDTIFGQDDDDVLFGDAGDDVIDGDIDDDVIDGGDGADTLTGGQGDDTISGGAITAGDGADQLFGDIGDDLFVGIGHGDVITGGEDADDGDIDVLNLTGVAEAVNPGGSLIVEYDPTDPEAGTIRFFDSVGTETGTATFSEIERVIPCFTPGTLIATPQGERRVEDLKVGDRVITRDNGIQAIRWVGRRDLSGDEVRRAADSLRPVLIRAGALGNDLPERDLLVSPNHRVLIANERTAYYFDDSEVLVAAKHLTGLDGVDIVEVDGVSYIHFMFDQHEVVLSDGAWTESFQPGDQTMAGMDDDQRSEIYALFPDLETAEGFATYSAARRSLRKYEARLLFN